MELDLSAFKKPDAAQWDYLKAKFPADQEKANALRAEEGSPTIEEEMIRMRQATQKGGTPDPSITEIKPNQVEPLSLDLSAFKKEDKIDLSAFKKPVESNPVPKDMGMNAETAKYLATEAGQSVVDIFGRMPAKFAMATGGAMAAAASIPISLATGNDVGKAAYSIMTDSVSPPEIQSKSQLGKGVDWLLEKGMEIAKEYGAASVEEYADRLGLSASNPVRALLHGGSQAAPDIGMTVLGLRMLKPKAPEVKPTPVPGIEPDAPPPTGGIPYDRPVTPYERPKSAGEVPEPAAPPPANVTKTVTPNLGEPVPGRETYNRGQEVYNILTSKKPAEKDGIPWDYESPVDAATPLSGRTAGLDRPLDRGLDLVDQMQEPARTFKQVGEKLEKELELEQNQALLDFDGNSAIDKAITSANKEGFLRDAVDLLNIKEGQTLAPDLVQPRVADFGRAKSQRGHGDVFNDFAKWSVERLQRISERLYKLEKENKLDDAGYLTLNQISGELDKRAHDGSYTPDATRNTPTKPIWQDMDRIPNGTVVQGSKLGKLVRGKVVETTMLKKEDSIQLLPVILDERTGNKVVLMPNEIGRVFTGPHPLGGVGKKQGGAIDFFGRKDKKDPTDTVEMFSLPKESTADFIARSVKPMDDIPNRFGMSSQTFRSVNPLIFKESMAARVALHFENKLQEASMLQHKLNALDKPVTTRFQKFYGVGTATILFNLKQWKKDVAMVLDWEKNPDKWFNGVDWYPSAEQMLQMGMPEASVKVWRGMFDVLDRTWGVIEQAATMAGRGVPPRIPGYVPHMWKGAYSVQVNRKHIEADGSVRIQNLAEFNYDSLKQAELVRESVSKAHPNEEVIIEKPNVHGSGVTEILEGLRRAADRLEAVKGLQALTESIYQSAAKGIVTHALDRAGVNKVGHLLERVNMEDNLGLSKKQQKEAVKSISQAVESVNQWYARTKFVTETLFPLDTAGFLEQKNLRQATSQYMENFFHIPSVMMRELDIKIKDSLVNHGFNPQFAGKLASTLNSGFAKYYLTLNASFYAVNALQFTIALPALYAMKAFGNLRGEKTGNIGLAFAKATASLKDIPFLKDTNPLVKYAKENGFIDPSGIEHLDPGKMKDPIAMGIERRTRMMSFLAGYEYYKQFMPEELALPAAGKFANMVSVPYAKELGAPAMMNRMPLAGTAMVMFMTYQNHMLGMINQQRALITQGVKTRNIASTRDALISTASLQALNVGLFGLGGLALISGYDAAIRLINQIFGTEFYTTKQLGRQLDETMHTNGIFQHGAASEVLGYDVSGSGSGVGVSLPTASVSAITAAAQGAILAGKFFKEVPPYKRAQWEWARTLPKQYQGTLEYLIKNDTFEDVVKQVKGQMPDYSAEKDINMQGIPRTRADTFTRLITGLKSTEEAAYNTSVSVDNMQNMRMKKKIDYQLQWLKERSTYGEQEQKILLDMALEAGKDPGAVVDAIAAYKLDTKMTPEQRKAKLTNSIEGIFKYNQFEQQRSLE